MNAIMISLDIGDAATVQAFVKVVIGTFKSQRMLSPPDTSGLLVTIIGPLRAEAFATQWRAAALVDQPLALFMGQMTIADVIQGTPSGEVLSQASLISSI